MHRSAAFIAFFILLSAALSQAHSLLEGRVVGVSDGDTITVLDAAKKQHRIRLAEIDAPEGGQAFGAQSKKALSEKVFGKTVQIAVTDERKRPARGWCVRRTAAAQPDRWGITK